MARMDHARLHPSRGRRLCGPGHGASEHALVPEPFLIVGLIATIRRLLVLTAEFARLVESNTAAFRAAMVELGLLTVMIVALVVSLVVLKRHSEHGSRREEGAPRLQ